MRTHEIVAAWLHIVVGGFLLTAIVVFWISAAGLAPLVRGIPWIAQLISAVGKPIAIAVIMFSSAELIGAIGVLRSRSWGRTTLLWTSAPEFLIVPIGTAIAAYTYWALWNHDV